MGSAARRRWRQSRSSRPYGQENQDRRVRSCLTAGERFREPGEPCSERVVADRERKPRPTATTLTEPFAGRNDDAILDEQALCRDARRQAEPDEERPLALRFEAAER